MFGHSDDQTCIPDLQLPKPWNFLSVENDKYVFCYVSEVTLESTVRMGTVMVGIFSPTSWPLGRGEGIEVESISSGQCCNQSMYFMKPPWKPKKTGLGELSGRWTCGDAGRMPFQHALPSTSLSPDCFWVISFSKYTNDLVSKMFFCVLWVILTNSSNLRRVSWESLI